MMPLPQFLLASIELLHAYFAEFMLDFVHVRCLALQHLQVIQHQILLIVQVQTHMPHLTFRVLFEHLIVEVGKMLLQLKQAAFLLTPLLQTAYTPMSVFATGQSLSKLALSTSIPCGLLLVLGVIGLLIRGNGCMGCGFGYVE